MQQTALTLGGADLLHGDLPLSDDWLELPTVESAVKLPGEKQRGKRMQHGLGKKKVWASDGSFVWFRRKLANPATLERHERFLSTGEYQYLGTQDDVEIYKLMPGSPFKRVEAVDFGALKFYDARRQTIRAAVRRDWATFIDGLEHLAGGIKGAYDPAMAKTVYNDLLSYVFVQVAMRGGPSQEEVDREVVALRKRRKDVRSTSMLLPAGISLQ
jgi:hypothetical protein